MLQAPYAILSNVLYTGNLSLYIYRNQLLAERVVKMATSSEFKTDITDETQEETSSALSNHKIHLVTELYTEQNKRWPKAGKHIMAQFHEENIVVYQAFKASIADYAVKHQRFGGPDYSFTRMSWIKTNFLWMMYRCGWAKKPKQEKVLALTISRTGFEEILAQAFTSELQKSKGLDTDKIQVRLQWDPDHYPSGEKVEGRRAIQLGLKGEILSKFNGMIVRVEDITDYVHYQHYLLKTEGKWKIYTPCEHVYPLINEDIHQRIELDYYDHSGPKLISVNKS